MKHSVSVRYAQLMPAVGGSGYQRCNRRVAGNRDFEVLARNGKVPIAKRHCAARITLCVVILHHCQENARGRHTACLGTALRINLRTF